MSKYYKDKEGCQIIKFISDTSDPDCFEGIVVVNDGNSYIGETSKLWVIEFFEPYTPTPQELIEWGKTATLTTDNPNKVEVDDKDVNLRLECLKLTVASNIGLLTDMGDITKEANVAYNWIKTNQ